MDRIPMYLPSPEGDYTLKSVGQDPEQLYDVTIKKVVHAGKGSDLSALCGRMEGMRGLDQVRLTYVDEQITCVKCLQIKLKKLKEKLDAHIPTCDR